MTTGFVWHELYAWHDPGSAAGFLPSGGFLEPGHHVDAAECKRRIRNLVDVSGLLDDLVEIKPGPATDVQLTRLHTRAYLDGLQAMSAAGGGDAGELSTFGPGGYEIAALAAGGCIAAVDATLSGRVDNAYALVRPCGHHVEAARGRGHGLFGNVALAALHAREHHGLERIAIVDWDVHHGNGTETAFYDDRDVLTISLHQAQCYPAGRGAVEDGGRGAARGKNVNIPLPPGSTLPAYRDAMERIVVPAVREHDAELVIVASGLDASQLDPNGRMMLSSEAFRTLARIVKDLAAETCDGRLVMCHEGGYSAPYAPFCGLAVLEELSGIRTEVEDPFLETLVPADLGYLTHQREAVDTAAEARLEHLAAGAATPDSATA